MFRSAAVAAGFDCGFCLDYSFIIKQNRRGYKGFEQNIYSCVYFLADASDSGEISVKNTLDGCPDFMDFFGDSGAFQPMGLPSARNMLRLYSSTPFWSKGSTPSSLPEMAQAIMKK